MQDKCSSSFQFNAHLGDLRQGGGGGGGGVLTKRIDFKLENVPKIILTCFALHNYCESKKSYIDEDIVHSHMQYQSNLEGEQANLPDKIYSGCASEGYLIRNMLTEYVTQNLPDSYQ